MTSPSASARILVIEDNDADVFLIRKALTDCAIRADFTVCEDGESAIRLLSAPGAPFAPDAIILDLALPRVEGLTVLRAILGRPALAHVPVMIFTSSPSPAASHRVGLLAPVRYLQKPSGVDEFLRVVGDNIRQMLAGTGPKSVAPSPG